MTVDVRCHNCGARPLQEGALPARLLAELDRAGEWLTAGALARSLQVRSSSPVAGALRRLVDRGLIRRIPNPRRGSYSRWLYRAQLPTGASTSTRSRAWPPTVTAGYLCSCGGFVPNPHRLPLEHVLSAHRQDHLFGVAS